MALFIDHTNYEKLNQDLNDFLKSSEANVAMLCDVGGNVIISNGKTDEEANSSDLISALVAASFSATKELASVLGEEQFTSILHQGKNKNIFISGVNSEVLLLTLFNNDTTIGLVKMYAGSVIDKLKVTLLDLEKKSLLVESSDPTASFVINKDQFFN